MTIGSSLFNHREIKDSRESSLAIILSYGILLYQGNISYDILVAASQIIGTSDACRIM
jgi:hypothetical protein